MCHTVTVILCELPLHGDIFHFCFLSFFFSRSPYFAWIHTHTHTRNMLHEWLTMTTTSFAHFGFPFVNILFSFPFEVNVRYLNSYKQQANNCIMYPHTHTEHAHTQIQHQSLVSFCSVSECGWCRKSAHSTSTKSRTLVYLQYYIFRCCYTLLWMIMCSIVSTV